MKEIFVTAFTFNHFQLASSVVFCPFLVQTEQLAEILERDLEVHRNIQIYRSDS